MGAVIGLRLTIQISSALEIPMPQTTFWVDSMNVVFWIHGQSLNYKPFLSHRVREIHEKSNPNQWRYVPNKQNPADHGTRGGREILVSVPLPQNALLSLGNGLSPRHSRFLNAFTRMAARRGWPKMMLSDNGTNFIAGDREIKELVA